MNFNPQQEMTSFSAPTCAWSTLRANSAPRATGHCWPTFWAWPTTRFNKWASSTLAGANWRPSSAFGSSDLAPAPRRRNWPRLWRGWSCETWRTGFSGNPPRRLTTVDWQCRAPVTEVNFCQLNETR